MLLAACKDVTPNDQSFVVGKGDVAVKQFRLVDPGDASGATMGGKVVYVVCKLEFTNDVRPDFTPQISSFVLTAPTGARYRAIESGSVATIGISNYAGPVKKDAIQEYTLAFRVPPGIGGTISYELFHQ